MRNIVKHLVRHLDSLVVQKRNTPKGEEKKYRKEKTIGVAAVRMFSPTDCTCLNFIIGVNGGVNGGVSGDVCCCPGLTYRRSP
jgi:hypothetical protein